MKRALRSLRGGTERDLLKIVDRYILKDLSPPFAMGVSMAHPPAQGPARTRALASLAP